MSKRRGFFVTLMALALALVAVAPAQAGRQWCATDPVFLIAGTHVNVVTAIWEEHQPAVTGPTTVTVYVPLDVSAMLVSVDDGYNGYGEVVSIVPTSRLKVTGRGVQVLVEVTVPASLTGMPVDVSVTPAGDRTVSVNGKSNTVIPVNLAVQPAP